jgi:hypothetical protein
MHRVKSVLIAVVLATAALAPQPMTVFALSNVAECDYGELGNSAFMQRSSNVPAGPWIASVSASITNSSNYPWTCQRLDPNRALWASASSAWVAIEGPVLPGSLGANSIVQVGFIKCQASNECDLSHIPASWYGRNVEFYAFGNANDVFNLPSPIGITASLGNRIYNLKLSLHYNADGTRDWWVYEDGNLIWFSTDMSRSWTRITAQTANELWNVGDSMGGVVGEHQGFTGISWYNGTTHQGLASQPSITGHCYPWGHFNPNPAGATAYYVWTSNNHTTCS